MRDLRVGICARTHDPRTLRARLIFTNYAFVSRNHINSRFSLGGRSGRNSRVNSHRRPASLCNGVGPRETERESRDRGMADGENERGKVAI